MLSALGFARYAILTPVGGCPRCRGAVYDGTCLPCGWDGPTWAPRWDERTPDARTPSVNKATRARGGVAYRSLSTEYLREVRRG